MFQCCGCGEYLAFQMLLTPHHLWPLVMLAGAGRSCTSAHLEGQRFAAPAAFILEWLSPGLLWAGFFTPRQIIYLTQDQLHGLAAALEGFRKKAFSAGSWTLCMQRKNNSNILWGKVILHHSCIYFHFLKDLISLYRQEIS